VSYNVCVSFSVCMSLSVCVCLCMMFVHSFTVFVSQSVFKSLFWVWVNSGRWWWTGRPGVLRFMGSQGVGHDWATELNWCWSSNTLATLWWRAISLEETLMLGKIEGKRRRGWKRMRRLDSILTQWTWIWANSGRQWKTENPSMLKSMVLEKVRHNLVTEQQQIAL